MQCPQCGRVMSRVVEEVMGESYGCQCGVWIDRRYDGKPMSISIDEPLVTWKRRKKLELSTWTFHHNPSVVSYIIIHHSLTNDGYAKEWDAIRKYHVEVKGWDDVGYHWGVERIKDDYQILEGRSMDKRGAHVKDGGFNNKSIGICVVGNFDVEGPPAKQWILTHLLVEALRNMLTSKGMTIPIENILGHREAQALAGLPPEMRKSCPGWQWDMDKFRSEFIENGAQVLG